MQDIKDYLNEKSPDIFTGLNLMHKYCSGNRTLLSTLSRSAKKSWALDKIIYELSKVSGQAYEGLEQRAKLVPKRILPPTATTAQTDETYVPGYLSGLVQQMDKTIYARNQKSNELAELTAAGNEEAAKALIDEIEALDQKVKTFEAQIAYFKENGKPYEPAKSAAPAKAPAKADDDLAELIKRRATVRTNVTKSKKAHEADPANPKKAQTFEKWSKELSDIDLKINGSK
jgi:chorismate mutase